MRIGGMQVNKTKQALKAAFPHTIPVLTGYIFLGIAFGVLLQSKGYGMLWAFSMSTFIFAGSMQFVAVGLLAGGFHPLQAALLTLMVNARHIFYGLAMLERFKDLRAEKPYMIFALTDETFSLLCSVQPPQGVDRGHFDLCIASLNHLYWITGSVIGALLGEAITINTTGIEFVMTGLFVVIFLEQWQSRKGRLPALIGLGVSVLCLVIFGADSFMLPTMGLLALLLLALRSWTEREVTL